MVFYRKYRPQKIEDLDSDNVRERLTSIFSSKNIPHAFLFTGPKGLGKTSTARIIAKIVNCEKLSGVEPCDKCNQCVSVTNGTNFDVLEIDAASNRGIDEIRDLREKIRLAPMKASKKVYIIDEVHMLTAEAFDALLKTLEEPPAHALFILCTTEPHKVPQTIVSRCTHITFSKATTEELVRSFSRIVKAEKIKIDKEVLQEIAKLSDGSFRDGVKILEELVVEAKSGEITKKTLEKTHKTSSLDLFIIEFLKNVKERDAKKTLEVIRKISNQGVDIKYFMEKLIEELHENLLAKIGVEGKGEENIDMEISEIKNLVEILGKAYSELRNAVLPELPLELAVIEFCEESSSSLRSQAAIVRGPVAREESSSSLRSHSQFGESSDASAPAKLGARSAPQTLMKTSPHDNAPREDSESGSKARQTTIAQRTGGAKTFLQELIEEVKPHNHSIAGVLRGCTAEINGANIVIKTGYKFHKEKLEEAKTIEVIEKVAGQIIGKKVRVSVILK